MEPRRCVALNARNRAFIWPLEMGPAWPHQPDLAPHTGVGGGACVSRARGIRVRAPPRGVVAVVARSRRRCRWAKNAADGGRAATAGRFTSPRRGHPPGRCRRGLSRAVEHQHARVWPCRGAAGRPRRRRGRFGPVLAFQRAERTSDEQSASPVPAQPIKDAIRPASDRLTRPPGQPSQPHRPPAPPKHGTCPDPGADRPT